MKPKIFWYPKKKHVFEQISLRSLDPWSFKKNGNYFLFKIYQNFWTKITKKYIIFKLFSKCHKNYIFKDFFEYFQNILRWPWIEWPKIWKSSKIIVDPSKNPSFDSEFHAEFDFDDHFRCIDFFKNSKKSNFWNLSYFFKKKNSCFFTLKKSISVLCDLFALIFSTIHLHNLYITFASGFALE